MRIGTYEVLLPWHMYVYTINHKLTIMTLALQDYKASCEDWNKSPPTYNDAIIYDQFSKGIVESQSVNECSRVR